MRGIEIYENLLAFCLNISLVHRSSSMLSICAHSLIALIRIKSLAWRLMAKSRSCVFTQSKDLLRDNADVCIFASYYCSKIVAFG